MKIVGARDLVCDAADFLDGGKQQADQDANDGDDDEQFNQREATPIFRVAALHRAPPQGDMENQDGLAKLLMRNVAFLQ
jgi:hypothetical protein